MNSISVTFRRNLKCSVCHLCLFLLSSMVKLILNNSFLKKLFGKNATRILELSAKTSFFFLFFSFFFTKNKWNLRWVNIKNQVLLIMPHKKIVSRKFFSRATRYVQNRLRLKSDPYHFRFVSRFLNLFVWRRRRRW